MLRGMRPVACLNLGFYCDLLFIITAKKGEIKNTKGMEHFFFNWRIILHLIFLLPNENIIALINSRKYLILPEMRKLEKESLQLTL